MIAFDKAQQVAYARAGRTEVWIWWYALAEHFVVTTRAGGEGGKVVTSYLAREIGDDSTKETPSALVHKSGHWMAPGDYGVDEMIAGAHWMSASLEYPNAILLAHRQGDMQLEGRFEATSDIFFAYKLIDWPRKTIKHGLVGWAY